MGSDLLMKVFEQSPVVALALVMLIIFSRNMAAERKDRSEVNKIFADTINNHLRGAGESLKELTGVIREMRGRVGV